MGHRGLCFDVAALRVERPRQQVVPVDVAARPKLDEHLAIHAGYVAMMVEQEETPGAVVRARLLQYGDVQCPCVLVGFRAVAGRGVGVAQCAERRRVERSGDRLLARGDRIPPFVPRGGEPRGRGEQSIVTGMGGEPARYSESAWAYLPPADRDRRSEARTTRPARGKVRRRERRLDAVRMSQRASPVRPRSRPSARDGSHREVVRETARLSKATRAESYCPSSIWISPTAARSEGTSWLRSRSVRAIDRASSNRCCARRLADSTCAAASLRDSRLRRDRRAAASARSASLGSPVSRDRWR